MGFLGKARNMMAGKAASQPSRPQYFQVSCAEGHVIRGERTEGYQALRCPHCGDGVFVLPRSSLPLPPAPASSRPKSRPAAVTTLVDDLPIELTDAPSQDDLDEIQWLEPEPLVQSAPVPMPASSPPTQPARQRPRPRPNRESTVDEPEVRLPSASPAIPSRPKPARVKPAVAPVNESESARDQTDNEATPRRVAVRVKSRKEHRVAKILVGVALLATATVGIRTWQQRIQELPHIAEVNATEGLAALEHGQFDEAKKKLGVAAKAFWDLKATDETATDTIQFAKEAAIYADLAHDTLKEIVDEIARLGDPDGPARFSTIHKGRSILVDSEVEDIREGVVYLAERIFIGRGPVPAKIGRLDLKGFTLFPPGAIKKEKHLTFGARLGSIRLEQGVWLITLEPESGVTMTNAKALAIVLNPSGDSSP